MIVFDPLYGPFEIPGHLLELLASPEVRRLSEVRLLNTMSTSLATLGELRRYSHTLGVLYLCLHADLGCVGLAERRAFEAAALLHDIGTPPFAHLFEYHLREKANWSHEQEIERVMRMLHAPENSAHQIYHGRTVAVREALKSSGISFELVFDIVSGAHPLSRLLFGNLDYDNLDNVARMACALGLEPCGNLAVRIAGQLTIGTDRDIPVLPQCRSGDVAKWASVRRAIYEILVFDPPTVAAQAVLSKAIDVAMNKQVLEIQDWSLTDEQLIDRLRENVDTKYLITNQYFGAIPNLAFYLQISGRISDYGVTSRREMCGIIEDAIDNASPGSRSMGYVFEDKGAFEKELSFIDPGTGKQWSLGQTSRSTVLYGFVGGRRPMSHQRASKALVILRDRLGLDDEKILRCRSCSDARKDNDQLTFDFTT